MRIAVPKETSAGERRVALVPESCKKLMQAGYDIAIEGSAGEAAGFLDAEYRDLGVSVAPDPAAQNLLILSRVAKMLGPLRESVVFVGGCVTGLLTTDVRSQQIRAARSPCASTSAAMDTLSSMANIGGYKGVLLAAVELPKYFPMLMTAAGMVRPAKVFVIGAGVAGLQAIATARRLGANVVATDVRPEVKEQIESVGAKYVGIELKESAAAGGGYAKELSDDDRRRQSELLAQECAQSDVVITTALIGGVFAPRLISGDTVKTMKPGSVIVDLGADGGGNCELSTPGETVYVGGVAIMAPLNLPATMPYHASLLFSRNLTAFIQAFTKDKAFQLDFNDDIQQGALITHDGEVKHARTREALQQAGL